MSYPNMRILLLLCSFALPTIASAHAFGQSFTLPLPLSFYVVAAGGALIASFAILSLWSTPQLHQVSNVRTVNLGRFGHIFGSILKISGVALLALTIAAAILGPSDYTRNLSVSMFWIALLLAFTYFSAIIGNLWSELNPLKTLAQLLLGSGYKPIVSIPSMYRYLPALIIYAGLLWLELLSFGLGAIPSILGTIIVGYVLLSFAGALLFGIEEWFTYGDFFSVYFALVSKFAPIQIQKNSVEITYPGERLITEKNSNFWELVLILAILASTVFDGLRDTEPWINALSQVPLFIDHYDTLSYIALALAPTVFLLLYALAVWLMKTITRSTVSVYALMLRFGYSLIPIAIAYNFAHYFGLILTEGQRLIYQISDPFSKGWDLFGTALFDIKPTLIGAASIWYLQAGAILVGHIIATYVAHRIALSQFSNQRAIIAGQVPVLVLMVIFTALGLWILSLPYAIGA